MSGKAEETQKSLADLVQERLTAKQQEQQKPEDDKLEDAQEEQVVADEEGSATEDESGEVDETTEDSESKADVKADAKTETKKPEDSQIARFIRDEFYKLGYDKDAVDSLTEEELVAEWRAELASSGKQPEEDEKPKAKKKPAEEEDDEEEVVEEKPKEKASSKEPQGFSLKALDYDKSLNDFVEFKQQSGQTIAIPKEGTGTEGKKAAETINAYAREYRDRQAKLAADPISLLKSDIEKLAEEIAAKKIEELKKELLGKEQENQKLNAQQREEKALAEFWEKHEKTLFKTDDQGNLKRSLRTKDLIPTDRGQQFEKIVEKIAKTSNAPLSVILEQAMDLLGELTPKQESKPSKEDKKREFLDRNRKNTSTSQASSGKANAAKPVEKSRTENSKPSLRELILNNPELQDNPLVAQLAGAQR